MCIARQLVPTPQAPDDAPHFWPLQHRLKLGDDPQEDTLCYVPFVPHTLFTPLTDHLRVVNIDVGNRELCQELLKVIINVEIGKERGRSW